MVKLFFATLFLWVFSINVSYYFVLGSQFTAMVFFSFDVEPEGNVCNKAVGNAKQEGRPENEFGWGENGADVLIPFRFVDNCLP